MSFALLALSLLLGALPAHAVGEEDGQNANPGILTVGGMYLFYNEQAPLSFVTLVPHEAPKNRVELGEVSGSSCQHGVSIPTGLLSPRSTDISAAAGNGGYFNALRSIQKGHPNLAGIYDVRADQRTLSILGVYRRLCIEIVARGFALK